HGGLFGLKIGDTQFNSGTEAQIALGGKRGLAPIPACQPNNRASPGRRDRKEARSTRCWRELASNRRVSPSAGWLLGVWISPPTLPCRSAGHPPSAACTLLSRARALLLTTKARR